MAGLWILGVPGYQILLRLKSFVNTKFYKIIFYLLIENEPKLSFERNFFGAQRPQEKILWAKNSNWKLCCEFLGPKILKGKIQERKNFPYRFLEQKNLGVRNLTRKKFPNWKKFPLAKNVSNEFRANFYWTENFPEKFLQPKILTKNFPIFVIINVNTSPF